jgi:polysaccharide deacetylase 2 family uncharacterized protein YibQ
VGVKKRAKTSSLWILAAVAIIAAVVIYIAGVSYQGDRNEAPGLSSPTTAWPHGIPEYTFEIPKGYEDLLPKVPAPPRATAQEPEPAPLAVPPRLPKPQGEGQGATLIIVIDDVGYNLSQLKPFLNLPFPLTIAILPEVDHTRQAAERSKAAGKEVILHQPMQALGGANPGPGFIKPGMSAEEIETIVSKNLDSLPEAMGMNNHMGSAMTRDAEGMRIVLDLVKRRGIYYLDSLTAPDTATAALSRELSMPYWERDVFLDNSGDRQSILKAIEDGKKTASSKGAAVLIGHVWSAELAQTLADIYPQLVEQGYSLSTISRFMIETAKDGENARSRD